MENQLVFFLINIVFIVSNFDEEFQEIKLENQSLEMRVVVDCIEVKQFNESALPRDQKDLKLEVKHNKTTKITYRGKEINFENKTKHVKEENRVTSYIAKIRSLIVLTCFSNRNHSWTSNSPNWSYKRKHVKRYFNDTNSSDSDHLNFGQYEFVSVWILPPFKVRHVRLSPINFQQFQKSLLLKAKFLKLHNLC